MKKLPVFLMLLFISASLWAQDDIDFPLNMWNPDINEESETPIKEEFRLKNRTVELSIGHFSLGAANNFISTNNIFRDPFDLLWNIESLIDDPSLIYKDPVLINIDDFFNGFEFNTRAAIKPLSLNFNWKDTWGFGLDIGHIDAWGHVSISEKLTAFKEGTSDKFGVGGAVFADVGIPVFFRYNDLKIKIRPAVYVPVVYTEPSITYSYGKSDNTNGVLEGMRLEVNYDMRIYSIIGLRSADITDMLQDVENNYWNILGNNLGYDFRLGLEYPWSYYLDIGVDIINIPFMAARLNHYTEMQGSAYFDTSNILDLENGLSLNTDDLFHYDSPLFKPGYDSNGKEIYRPFTMLFYADYRLFDSRRVALIPSLGFSINYLYPSNPASIEGGLNVRFDRANIFIATLGVNYNDRTFKNSIDIALNLRAIEIDFGLSMQSPDFVKSWQGAGFGVSAGLKLGW